MIQPQSKNNPEDLARMVQKHKYSSQLGSSKNRTAEQQEMGLHTVQKLLTEAPTRSAVASTNSFCLSNPGTCGSGAVVLFPDNDCGLELTARGSILLAELVAILLVLEVMKVTKAWEFSSNYKSFLTVSWQFSYLTLLHSERPKLYTILVFDNWTNNNYTELRQENQFPS